MTEEKPSIDVNKDGPYIVRGIKTIRNSRGSQIEAKDVVALCRCGGSNNKPFCDGSHRSNGFKDEKN